MSTARLLHSQLRLHLPRRHMVHARCASSGGSKKKPARVLLTNDDGPDSAFFKAWVPHVQEALG